VWQERQDRRATQGLFPFLSRSAQASASICATRDEMGMLFAEEENGVLK
jgi:hypothetical protein